MAGGNDPRGIFKGPARSTAGMTTALLAQPAAQRVRCVFTGWVRRSTQAPARSVRRETERQEKRRRARALRRNTTHRSALDSNRLQLLAAVVFFEEKLAVLKKFAIILRPPD